MLLNTKLYSKITERVWGYKAPSQICDFIKKIKGLFKKLGSSAPLLGWGLPIFMSVKETCVYNWEL